MAISFNPIGAFKGVNGAGSILLNPTSIQFGPDGRLYVSEQNGMINAFTVAIEGGEYIATAVEEIDLVQQIQNHNDDGSLSTEGTRQVTGIVVTGTPENPVLYVGSSDPRIAKNADSNLDTNSGVITRLTYNGSSWEAVDLVRGLPRSEENHSNNGMVLSPDGTKLYVAVGGNTNNGAPSQFFANTAEYALSGTVLEIDLVDIESRPILTDTAPGQNGRQYVYDLPTLDDPNIPNVTDGIGEDEFGMDEAGPWGGNDGLNMAILPADAPLRIYAAGFRNNYDLVMTDDGRLYTVDNGSNGNLGGDPILDANGEATNQINNGGSGNPEPLFLVEEGGYYGHPNPTLANQDQSWIAYDDSGNPDSTLAVSTVADISALVPDGVNIADGFLVDPSKFTADPARLLELGIRIPYNSAASPSLLNIGSSSNGLVEYTGTAFEGALLGDLLVAQFNGSIGRLNLNADGTAATYETINGLTGLGIPLDVTMGPDGTIWVAALGSNEVKVFAPSDLILPSDPDIDNDGIDNIDDPFTRDATNGRSVVLFGGQTLLWDFDANQDDNLPGPDGYGGGLTGVMVNGVTNFEEFFTSPSDLPDQNIKLDNVKFITAAGGGTTVVENVSNGDATGTANSGEYLFHTGMTIAPMESFTVRWTVYNPGAFLTGPDQQIGGYIGTGDQRNYLKFVASPNANGELMLVLENDDAIVSTAFLQADNLFSIPDGETIDLELLIDPIAGTATPTATYGLGDGTTQTVTGTAMDLTGTNVLSVIQGDYTVQGQQTGIALGLYSSNVGQDPANTFQAIFDQIEVTGGNSTQPAVLYRVNAGGAEVAAIDGGPNWLADTGTSPSPYLTSAGSNKTSSYGTNAGGTVPPTVPDAIFQSERWDNAGGTSMQWSFAVPTPGLYEVRLFMGNGAGGTSDPGERVFDVAIEGTVLDNLDNIDLSAQFGHQVGGMISNVVAVGDGILNLEFLHDAANNPLINGIEILKLDDTDTTAPTAALGAPLAEPTGSTTTPQLIEVNFGDDYGLNLSTLDGDELQVINLVSGEPLAVTLVEVNGTTATYAIAPPNGAWTQTEFAQYSVEIVAGSVSDVSGNGITTTALGTFGVSAPPDPTVSLLSSAVSVGEGAGQLQVAFGTDVLVPAAESVTVTFEIVPGTATPQADYQYSSATATFDPQTGIYTDTIAIAGGTDSASLLLDMLQDDLTEGNEAFTINITSVSANAQMGTSTATVTITDDESPTVLYRVNAGGEEVAALDGGPNWSADTTTALSAYLADPGVNKTDTYPITAGSTVAPFVPEAIFQSQRWDNSAGTNMKWAFDAAQAGLYEVRLFMGNGWNGTSEVGERIFDVAIEGMVLPNLDNIDLSAQFGHRIGGMISNIVEVTDGVLDIEFLHDAANNPLINGIEILQLGAIVDELAPTASLASPLAATVSGTSTPQLIQVEFTDNLGVDLSTIDGDELRVTDALGNALAVTLESVNGTTATYAVAAPGGLWSMADTFTVSVIADSITDISGNTMTGTVLGTFEVSSPPPPIVSIISGDLEASEADGQVQISLTTDVTVPSDEFVTVTFEIVPNGATPEVDYAYNSGTYDPNTGIYTDTVTIAGSSSDATFLIDILQDELMEIASEAFTVNLISVSDNATLGTATATVTIADDEFVPGTVLYRVNAGGGEVAALDGGPNWSADTTSAPSPYLADPGVNKTSGHAVTMGSAIDPLVPEAIFKTERWDQSGGTNMKWAFDAAQAGLYEVRLFMGNGWNGTSEVGERVFDVAIEGAVLPNLDNIDLSAQFGHRIGGMISNVVEVTDGTLDIEFLHDAANNPIINGIEIVRLGAAGPDTTAPIATLAQLPGSILAETSAAQLITVDFTDNVNLDAATIDGDELQVTDAGGNALAVTLDSVNGTTATYAVTAPGGIWDEADNGLYTAQVLAGSVTDAAGNAIAPTALGDFEVAIVEDLLSPTASLAQPLSDIVIATSAAQFITIDFADNVALDAATLDGDELQVTDAGGNALAVTLDSVNGTTATYAVTAPGGIWDEADNGFYGVEVLAGSVTDAAGNAIAPTALGDFEVAIVPGEAVGAAIVSILKGNNNIQKSNFSPNSFLITNVGDKTIAKVELNVAPALYPDSIFDPEGLAGDTASKALKIDTSGGTGVIDPTTYNPYIGSGGTLGYKGLEFRFDTSVNGGFETGETLGFSIDMDPNSVAGTNKTSLDAGTNPFWDVGGVSGAELIGSTVTVTFTDGTTAVSQLQGDGTNAGAQTLATQDSPNLTATLTVNGLTAGGLGYYDSTGPSVILNGPAGETARVVLTKGFMQPTTPYAQFLQNQLDGLAAQDFPVNNAVEFQTVDIVLTGGDQDISSLFDFSGVAGYDFAGEDQLPLGFVASVIDPSNDDLPLGAVTAPIYLNYLNGSVFEGTTANDTLTGTANDDVLLGGAGDDILNGGLGADDLTGGEGQDTFVIAATSGMDIFKDFQLGEDVIGLAEGLTFGQLSFQQVKDETLLQLASTNETLAVLKNTDAAQLIAQQDTAFVTL